MTTLSTTHFSTHKGHERTRKRTAVAAMATVSATSATAAPIAATPCVGIVEAAGERGWQIRSGGLQAWGRRAASCLIEPMPGDTVACLRVAPDEVWVLAVLMREESAPTVLRCHGATRLEVAGGPLDIAAPQVRIDAQRMGVESGELYVETQSMDVTSESYSVVGSTLRVVGAMLSTVFDRVSHFAKLHSRTTDGLDRVQANCLEQEAKQLVNLTGEHVIVNGSKLIKARGGQIHFG